MLSTANYFLFFPITELSYFIHIENVTEPLACGSFVKISCPVLDGSLVEPI